MANRNKALLDLVSDVKARLDGKVDAVSFPIPQFIVIGKQSVGKSRLIESLAGETFNFVSGTLGSRRPTVLEFRNAPQQNQWSVFDDKSMQWKQYPVAQVMQIVGQSHESLGASVTDVPIRVKVEGQDCVDLGIVDLPGFRAFAKDADKTKLAGDIERLATKFMSDENNVMLCVEEAGDNAGFSTLAKCKQVDPQYRRTVLIRNKLDKYYNDLTSDNINKWMKGFGDLPENLHRFALSLPHWAEGSAPKPFAQMRMDCAARDLDTLSAKGLSGKYKNTVGFGNFQEFIQIKTQQLFKDALGPMQKRLQSMTDENSEELSQIAEMIELSDENNILHATRAAGVTFAQSFNHLMEGALNSEHNRITLEAELRQFQQHCKKTGCLTDADMMVGPFKNLDEYIAYLREKVKLAGMDVELNGGSQFRRMMLEVEVFVRFAGLAGEFTSNDITQARGAGTPWETVIMNMLFTTCPRTMMCKTKYVGERLKWFFSEQKETTVQFMLSIQGSPEEHMFSRLISKKAHFIQKDPTAKRAIFQAFDAACDVNKRKFEEMWDDYMNAMFQSPVKLLKNATTDTKGLDDDEEGLAPTFDTTKDRIDKEITERDQLSSQIMSKIKQIPEHMSASKQALTMVEEIMSDIFGRIRSLVADQMQLYSESFFLLPMLRRLEGEMAKMELADSDRARYQQFKKIQVEKKTKTSGLVTDLEWCTQAVKKFQIDSS